MGLRATLSITPLLLLFCMLDWIIGVPLPNNYDGNGGPVDTTQNETFEGQPFPSEDDENEYDIIDDMYIKKDPTRSGLGRNSNWPNGSVPYTFARSISRQQRITINNAMRDLASISCITFRPATRADRYNVEFNNNGNGCSSLVGWQNRRNQGIQLATSCSKGNVIHEILHALGFFHEQTRDDRDDYVTINFDNITPSDARNNFVKDSELNPNTATSYYGVAYNFDSIMHYGPTFFAKPGTTTIDANEFPKDDYLGSPDNMGQRDYISDGDMNMLNSKYNCDLSQGNGMDSSSFPEEGENLETTTLPATTRPTTNPSTTNPTTTAPTTKPTTKNPMCKFNPNLPSCK